MWWWCSPSKTCGRQCAGRQVTSGPRRIDSLLRARLGQGEGKVRAPEGQRQRGTKGKGLCVWGGIGKGQLYDEGSVGLWVGPSKTAACSLLIDNPTVLRCGGNATFSQTAVVWPCHSSLQRRRFDLSDH